MGEDQILGDHPDFERADIAPSPSSGSGVCHLRRVTLLCDESLSFRLVSPESRLLPNSRHVRDAGLADR